MGLFGLGKKKDINPGESMDSKKDKEEKSKHPKFTLPKKSNKEEDESQMSNQEPSFEEDLKWDESLPGFDQKEKHDMSLPSDDSNELDSLASDAGLNLPSQEYEKEKPKQEGSEMESQQADEDISFPSEFPEDVLSDETSKAQTPQVTRATQTPQPQKNKDAHKPKKIVPETSSQPSPSFRIYVKNNNLFIPQEGYQEFYSILDDVEAELESINKKQDEVKNFEEEIKDSGNNFAREIRAISSIAMDSEDIIRKGGDKE